MDCLSNTKKNGRKMDEALNYVGEKRCSEVNQASVECNDPSISTIPSQQMHQEYQQVHPAAKELLIAKGMSVLTSCFMVVSPVVIILGLASLI